MDDGNSIQDLKELVSGEGFKKGQVVLVVGSGGHSHAELVRRLHTECEKIQVAMYDMAEAGMAASEAGMMLSEALKKMPMVEPPKDMICIDADFSKLESIVMDSIAPIQMPINFAGRCYDESGPISKKAFKKLKKKQARIDDRFDPKPQKEIWANKWNKKIKRKL